MGNVLSWPDLVLADETDIEFTCDQNIEILIETVEKKEDN